MIALLLVSVLFFAAAWKVARKSEDAAIQRAIALAKEK